MTHITILGQSQGDEARKKIEFVHGLDDESRTEDPRFPNDFENIMLLSKNYCGSSFDLMYAWEDIPNEGYLYLGHFNDGIV